MTQTPDEIATRAIGTIKDWDWQLQGAVVLTEKATVSDLRALLALIGDLAEAVRILSEQQKWRSGSATPVLE